MLAFIVAIPALIDHVLRGRPLPEGEVRITIIEATALTDQDDDIYEAAREVGVDPDVYRARIANGQCPRTGNECPVMCLYS